MSKDTVDDWDATAANNTDIGGIALGEGVMAISSVNDAIRTIMAQIAAAAFVSGVDSSFAIKDDGDATKIWKVQVSGLTTGTTRTVTMLDASGSMVLDTATQLLTNKTLQDSTTSIVDNSDATKQLAFEVSGITTGNKRVATPPDANFKMAALDVAAQVVTGGARVTSNAVGTVSSGTQTLDPGTRPLWDYTNGGAHTLAPGSNNGTIVLDITNNGSAGAITTSGWTKVVGAFDTTNTHKFRCFCSIGAAGSLLTIQPLQ